MFLNFRLSNKCSTQRIGIFHSFSIQTFKFKCAERAKDDSRNYPYYIVVFTAALQSWF